MDSVSSNKVCSITVNVLDYDNKEEVDKVYDFLENHIQSMVQQYPLIKHLYLENNQKFYYLYCKDDGVVVGTLSFVVYMNKMGNIIQSNPMLGYGGIVSIERNKEEIFDLLIKHMLEIGKKYNCITVTIGTSIFDENLDLYKKILKPDFIKENFYQFNTLEKLPINKLNSKRRSTINNEINKSVKNNVEIIKNGNMYFEEWYKIHSDRFCQINVNPLPYNFLKNIVNYFTNKNLASFYYAIINGQLIGGTLVIQNKNVIDYFATSFKSEYVKINASQHMLNQIHKDAIQKNIRIFNWESSPSKDSGVYKFKKRWGASEGKHYYITKVLGDIDILKNSDIELVKRNYRGYYLIPYEFLR